jgi:hypothetical protein
MQGTSFIALTGHLNDYPLSDLIGILRHQRKTGRLLIEYSISPCSLFFADGNLVDAQLNSMGGLQAVLVALSQPNASFNFNPLIQPPRRSINAASQKVILELLGCWDEKTIDVEAAEGNGKAFSAPAAQPAEYEAERADGHESGAMLPAKEVLALPPSSVELANRRRNRRILIGSAIVSLIVSLVTVVAVTRWLVKRDIAVALSEAAGRNGIGKSAEAAGTSAQVIKVTVRVEKGRVSEAFVEERQPGLEAYEALALRIARERRYSASASGQEKVSIKIYSPD